MKRELNIEALRNYCISKPFVTEEFPFDEVTLVFKVAGKMFALIPLDESRQIISLKCDPERAIELREQYPAIKAAYHMNKKHWNMIEINGSVNSELVYGLVDHSYGLIFNALPKRTRDQLLLDK
ncbi:MAG: MmcQ/YjbR family DNA-binding protein [Salinivirgaceae bacterium]|nr:MmcQ/YjbR family DNA-binding protein [Salinivirgaceae bacterium]MDD4746094.1 MmcQ/YjbR family DNA-binding protein [Salinivirgaceae bacterium]MDY0281091.1 MmcQ/YjbR family DNA-binding protein [Salinivirgaceae bacterium]